MAEMVPVDDFGSYSDGDISTQGTAWDIGSADDWNVENSGAATQGKLLRNDHLEGDFQISTNIASDSGLNAYPQKGGLTQVWVRLASGEATGFYFGGTGLSNTYEVELDTTDSGNNSVGIIEWEGGATNYIAENTGLSLNTTGTIRVDIYWNDPNRADDIDVEVYEGDTLATSLSSNVTVSYDTGLVGMYGEGQGTAWDTIKTETTLVTRTATSFAKSIYANSTVQGAYQRIADTFSGTTKDSSTRSLSTQRSPTTWLNAINSDSTKTSVYSRVSDSYTKAIKTVSTNVNAIEGFEEYNLGDVDDVTTAWTGSAEIVDKDSAGINKVHEGTKALRGSAESLSGLPRYPEKGTRTVFYGETNTFGGSVSMEFAIADDGSDFPAHYEIEADDQDGTLAIYESASLSYDQRTLLNETDMSIDIQNGGISKYSVTWEPSGTISVVVESLTHDKTDRVSAEPDNDLTARGIRFSADLIDTVEIYDDTTFGRLVETFTSPFKSTSSTPAQTTGATSYTDTVSGDVSPTLAARTYSKAVAATSSARELIAMASARMGQARHGEARHGFGVPAIIRNALSYTKAVATESTKSSVFGRVADTFTNAITSDGDRSSSKLRNLASYVSRSDSDSDRSLSLSRLGETYTASVFTNALAKIIRVASTYTPGISTESDRSLVFNRQPISYTKYVASNAARSKYMPRSVVQFTGQVATTGSGVYRRVVNAVGYTGTVGTTSNGISGLARKGVTYTKSVAQSTTASLLGFIPIKPLKAQFTDNTKTVETEDGSKDVMVRKSTTSVNITNDEENQ